MYSALVVTEVAERLLETKEEESIRRRETNTSGIISKFCSSVQPGMDGAVHQVQKITKMQFK